VLNEVEARLTWGAIERNWKFEKESLSEGCCDEKGKTKFWGLSRASFGGKQ
jgi:hypothetical protein